MISSSHRLYSFVVRDEPGKMEGHAAIITSRGGDNGDVHSLSVTLTLGEWLAIVIDWRGLCAYC